MREIKFRAWDKIDKRMGYARDFLHIAGTFNELYEWGEEAESRFELMQYTGLKDKNGKEIYEGDILQDGKAVEYVPLNEGYDGEYGIGFNVNAYWADKEFMVIGNIYENPDLLKEVS